jgi:hypothetical protein
MCTIRRFGRWLQSAAPQVSHKQGAVTPSLPTMLSHYISHELTRRLGVVLGDGESSAPNTHQGSTDVAFCSEAPHFLDAS